MRIARLTITLALLSAVAAQRAESQLIKRVGESIKQRLEQRKQEAEDSLVKRAADPADSLVHRVKRPVDSATSRAGNAVSKAAANVGRGAARSAEEKRLLAGLERGSVQLPAVQFAPGKAEMSVASEDDLADLVKVITADEGSFLIRAKADPNAPAGKARALGLQRATALKNWLVARGAPPARLFAAADPDGAPSDAPVSLLRIQ